MAENTTLHCTHCGNPKAPALAKAPFPNALGERIHAAICQDCWKAWLAKQNQLMNHFGLNTMDPDHRAMIVQNMKGFLFGEGETADVDASKQGTITHIQK